MWRAVGSNEVQCFASVTREPDMGHISRDVLRGGVDGDEGMASD